MERMSAERTLLKKRRRMLFLAILAFAVCLSITIGLYVKADSKDVDSAQQVTCTVTRIDVHNNYMVKVNHYSYTYYGTYNAQEYEIYNVTSGQQPLFMEGSKVQVYLYKGKLYANLNGIKTDTAVFNVYLVFLALTAIAIYFLLLAAVYYKKARKAVDNSRAIR